MLIDFCSYNIRGLNNKTAFVKDFLSSNKISFVALLETHVKQESALAISSFVAPNFSWSFNYDFHNNGRIWLGWDSALWDVTHLSASTQQITCSVSSRASGRKFCLTVVYGLYTYIDRRPLWNELLALQDHIASRYSNPPWCIIGDFNAFLDPDEALGGNRDSNLSMVEFKQCIIQMGVTDLRATGKKFTWRDNNNGFPIERKLIEFL